MKTLIVAVSSSSLQILYNTSDMKDTKKICDVLIVLLILGAASNHMTHPIVSFKSFLTFSVFLKKQKVINQLCLVPFLSLTLDNNSLLPCRQICCHFRKTTRNAQLMNDHFRYSYTRDSRFSHSGTRFQKVDLGDWKCRCHVDARPKGQKNCVSCGRGTILEASLLLPELITMPGLQGDNCPLGHWTLLALYNEHSLVYSFVRAIPYPLNDHSTFTFLTQSVPVAFHSRLAERGCSCGWGVQSGAQSLFVLVYMLCSAALSSAN